MAGCGSGVAQSCPEHRREAEGAPPGINGQAETFGGSAQEWDAFVRRQAGWTHFHLYGWKAVIERVLGHESIYLAARDEGGALTGVLPLVRVQSALFGHYLVSMPFVNYGGPLGEPAAVRAPGRRRQSAGRRERRQAAGTPEPQELPLDLPVSHRKVTVVLDLPGDAEALMKAFGAKLRSQVRRPEKEGVTYASAPTRSAPSSAVFARHMRDLGTPDAAAGGLFEAIAAALSGRRLVRLRLARRPADRRRGRVSLGRRVRDDLGLVALRVQPPSAQHGALLGVHGAGHAASG